MRCLPLQINVSNIVREMRLQRHGMIQTKVSVDTEVRVHRKENRKPDVAFVSLLSGPVSLLLQSLAGGFTGHFTASRQPMATGKSTGPQSSLSVFHPWFARLRSTQHCSPSLHSRVTPDSWAVVSDSFRDLKAYKKHCTAVFLHFVLRPND